MRRILVTGGPVHDYLDAVKILTNRFKGGRMQELAQVLAGTSDAEITYLGSKLVRDGYDALQTGTGIKLVTHDGYRDYREKVRELAVGMDAVILGAAVANLVPVNPWKGKFPSHQYRIGDIIDVPMTIAPRVIDEVKRAPSQDQGVLQSPHKTPANPNCHLFGFKLLKGVPHEELIHAAYEIVLSSGATCVFANDADNLDQKYAVTKERAVIPLQQKEMADFIFTLLGDEYYKTEIRSASESSDAALAMHKMQILIDRWKDKFIKVQGGVGVGGYVFGCIAVRLQNGCIYTTTRGKEDLTSFTWVTGVDHEKRVVSAFPQKATLNAPLLDWIFKKYPQAEAIVHYHELNSGEYKLPWAPPGTVRDSQRPVLPCDAFEIEHHGVYRLITKVLP